MANDFAELQREIDLKVETTAKGLNEPWLNWVDPIVLPEGATTHTERMPYGDKLWTSNTDGAPAAMDVKALKSQTAPTPFAFHRRFTRHDIRLYPDLVLQAAVDALIGWVQTVGLSFLGALAAADSHTHPADGSTIITPTGGGTMYFCDAFTIDPTSGGANFVQQNVYGASLGASALDTALSARGTYRAPSGNPTPAPYGKAVPFCTSTLAQSFRNLVRRPAEIYTGSGLENGGFGDQVESEPLVFPGGVTARVLWGLFWRTVAVVNGKNLMIGPINPVIHDDISIRIEAVTGTNQVAVVGEGAYAMHFRPTEEDLILSVVS